DFPPRLRSFPWMSPGLAEPQWRRQKEWRKTRVSVGKMISSVKKRFLILADFRVKRKMMRQDRHAGRETPKRHEHSKNAENPFIAAASVSRPTSRLPSQYVAAVVVLVAG